MRGFTLIELLVVVAIIAIIAAIAVPNFLEAQTRAKVARTRADLRTVATALEAYRIDRNNYPPNDGQYNVLPIELSTPVAFITSTHLLDPFNNTDIDPVFGELSRHYSYFRIVHPWQVMALALAMRPPAVESIDSPSFNPGAFQRYGDWRIVGVGPDMTYSDFSMFPNAVAGSDIAYDATNGTTSWGNLIRTQLHATEVTLGN